MKRLVDSNGKPVQLAGQIGKGGEGSVYEIVGQPRHVAKVYHKLPLADDHNAKLQAMTSRWSKELEAISAWPRSVLYDHREKACGILLPKVVHARHLHELYGTTNRRRHFPGTGWHHLLLAARNTAAAFYTLHEADIVIGDVNQGNLLVDKQMCVRLIDCDSFQLNAGDRTFYCPVGTPHFTPPELQGKKLSREQRTTDHDAFGLAVLIFHLLFVGRHPFAGRYCGAGDLSITKAIAERRFAFSWDRKSTLVDPPPASLRLDDLPVTVASLFEAAFRGDGLRPSPERWVQQLEILMQERRSCSFDLLHTYYRRLDACPWCRIEDEGGPTFFVPKDGASVISVDRLVHLNRRIDELRPARFPPLTPRRLEPPRMPPLKRLAAKPPWAMADAAAIMMAAAACFCMAGIAFAPALLAGFFAAAGGGIFLLVGKEARARRQRVRGEVARLEEMRHKLLQMARRILDTHQKRARVFDRADSDLRTAMEHYRAEGAQLKDVLAHQREIQLHEFLRGHLLRDHIRQIAGLTRPMVAMLESFGVESALEVDDLSLCAVPNVTAGLTVELVQWRSLLESEFVFQPDHGITFQELQHSQEEATRRFKLNQARKVLTGAKQVETLAHAGQIELDRSLGRFDALAAQWRGAAAQLRDFQSSRRYLERVINRSPATILACAAGIPLVGFLFRLVFI